MLFIFCLLTCSASSQTHEQSAWIAYFNSLKLSQKWGLHLDVQARSADDVNYVKHLLIRPGLTYYFDSKQNVTVGYGYIGTFNNPDIPTDRNLTEHRIWEQYIRTYQMGRVAMAHRFRLEQRFIERPATDIFAQRLRYFIRAVLPLKKPEATFDKGVFLALQNELFLNLQNKDKLNGHVFDQNRAYVAAGYRLNPKFDIEAGYLNHYTDAAGENSINHVAQLAFYTRF